MTYDGAVRQVVLFGGLTITGTYFGDTWTWNGSTWSQQSTDKSPPARSGASMVYDASTRQLVLFDGQNTPPGGNTSYLNDTWKYRPLL
jgi:hypothetical protein